MFSCGFSYLVVSGEWPMLLEHRARVLGAQRLLSECFLCGFSVIQKALHSERYSKSSVEYLNFASVNKTICVF